MSRLRAALVLLVLGASLGRADVTTSVSGTKLVVVGDDAPDTVSIEATDGGVAVIGHDGTLVDGSALPATFSGVQRLAVKLGRGSDWLTVTNVTFSQGINVRLGDGHDAVELDGTSGGATHIRTGSGDDLVQVFGPSRLKQLSIDTNEGWDLVVLDGAWVTGSLYVDTGSQSDELDVFATEVGDDVHAHMGNDDDLIALADISFDDDTHLDGERDDNFLVFAGYIWFGDELDIDGFDGCCWW